MSYASLPFFCPHFAKVEVGLLYDLPTAKSVATEPLTPDDWEILVHEFVIAYRPITHVISQELHAEHVESTLLSQVRVAPSNQEVDVWVLGRTRIRLRVRTWLHILLFPTVLKSFQFHSNRPLQELSCLQTILSFRWHQRPAASETPKMRVSKMGRP